MSERPILFTGPMVRSILDGRKTVTRRLKFLGQVGDVLWVKETWALMDGNRHFDGTIGRWREVACGQEVHYRAGAVRPNLGKWRPSIYMPRWASRIDLKTVSVQQELLQGISYIECQREGLHHVHRGWWVIPTADDPVATGDTEGYRVYKKLWDSINGPGSWDSNPLVYRIEFKVLKP